jgi:hypothetical protein
MKSCVRARGGCHHSRDVLTSAGSVHVTVPRVNDKCADAETGERQRFSSAILPQCAQDAEDRRGVAHCCTCAGSRPGIFVPTRGQLLNSAKGLSSSTISKLTETWKSEARAFAERDLSSVDYVYLWADGIRLNVRLEESEAVPAGDDWGRPSIANDCRRINAGH